MTSYKVMQLKKKLGIDNLHEVKDKDWTSIYDYDDMIPVLTPFSPQMRKSFPSLTILPNERYERDKEGKLKWVGFSQLVKKEEKRWRESVPNAQERAQIFIEEGVSPEEIKRMRLRYLREKLDEKINQYLETPTEITRRAKEKAKRAYDAFREWKQDSITDEMVERAKERRVDEFIQVGRDRKALCPFHNERHPSFSVYEDGLKFKCFGCGAQGTAITFIMKTRHYSFKQAVKFLNGD